MKKTSSVGKVLNALELTGTVAKWVVLPAIRWFPLAKEIWDSRPRPTPLR
jgi:hypothetical protein